MRAPSSLTRRGVNPLDTSLRMRMFGSSSPGTTSPGALGPYDDGSIDTPAVGQPDGVTKCVPHVLMSRECPEIPRERCSTRVPRRAAGRRWVHGSSEFRTNTDRRERQPFPHAWRCRGLVLHNHSGCGDKSVGGLFVAQVTHAGVDETTGVQHFPASTTGPGFPGSGPDGLSGNGLDESADPAPAQVFPRIGVGTRQLRP